VGEKGGAEAQALLIHIFLRLPLRVKNVGPAKGGRKRRKWPPFSHLHPSSAPPAADFLPALPFAPALAGHTHRRAHHTTEELFVVPKSANFRQKNRPSLSLSAFLRISLEEKGRLSLFNAREASARVGRVVGAANLGLALSAFCTRIPFFFFVVVPVGPFLRRQRRRRGRRRRVRALPITVRHCPLRWAPLPDDGEGGPPSEDVRVKDVGSDERNNMQISTETRAKNVSPELFDQTY